MNPLARLITIVVLTLTGLAMGWIGVSFVWDFIYGIGGSVVTDEEYGALLVPVARSGMIAGAISGFLVGAVLRFPESALVVLGLHLLSVIVGSAAAFGGRKCGLIAYHSTHAVVVLAAFVVALGRAVRKP